MWDEGAGPLWGDEGLLPVDPRWLREVFGLSESLVADLLTWLKDMDDVHGGQAQALIEPRRRELSERLQADVGSRFRVSLEE